MEPPPSAVPVNSQLMDASASQPQPQPQSSTLLPPQIQQQQSNASFPQQQPQQIQQPPQQQQSNPNFTQQQPPQHQHQLQPSFTQPQLQQQQTTPNFPHQQQPLQQPTHNFPQQLQPHMQQQVNPNFTQQQQPQQQQSKSNFTQQQQQPQQSSFPQQQLRQPNRLPFNGGTQPAWAETQLQSASQVAQLSTQPAAPQIPSVPMNSQAVDSPSQLQSSGFPQQQLQQQKQQQQHSSSPSIPSTNYTQQQQPHQQQQQQPCRISFNSGAQPVWMGSQTHSGSQYAQFTPSSAPLRGGIAIGVPSQPTSSFGPRIPVTNMSVSRPPMPSTSLDALNPVNNMPDSRSQISETVIIGSQQARPGGVPQSQSTLQRPILAAASGTRPPSTTTPPQNLQSQGIFRAASASLTNSSTPSTSQGQQSSYQPWLSAQHGRPHLPSQSVRPQVTSPPLQQRPHIPQQSVQPMPASSQSQQLLSSPQQQHFSASIMSHNNGGQQLPSSRVPQPLSSQQNVPRVHGSSSQNPPSPAMGQASIGHADPMDKTSGSEAVESCSRILSKRSILELVNQVDPSEKLDPEVEDTLVDIAEDFIDSVATFGCSLAKHRKSNTLEAKDILLHIERTWNMTLPGFSGDEIKTYKKPVANDIHKERLAVIRKSQAGAEMHKSSAGQAVGNPKGALAKVAPTIIGS